MSDTRSPRLRRAGALALLLAGTAAAVASAAPSSGELQQRLGDLGQQAGTLRGSIAHENDRIADYQGPIDELTRRLQAIETTLQREQTQLADTRRELREARARLIVLRTRLADDRRALAAQLVAQYELPQEDVVSIVVNARGFAGLLEQADDLDRIRHENVRITRRVSDARIAVAAQTRRLTAIERRRRALVDGSAIQRDEAARLRLAVVDKQLVHVRARSRDRAALTGLEQRRTSVRAELRRVEAQAARAAAANSGATVPGASVASAPFAAHGGDSGFFQAAGTNYAVGDEPLLAARLDRLGKTLGLHLTGISGYRTPQHSVEVGGFPNDPHTRGEASDTPGVEGVSEATLNQFGLTRPFGGAAEADHIQLLGG
ncbi:D-Ala-D-Ala carboxypeptidase family metallohydrolase [Conexibacter sp. JD483]|uniref:D-Ala-D-Ala carboxypeptidase family metallohydrolase n=1 Tax=unclassified Conexibacter TaxID=2627773 RepID=UPI00271CA13B|nr:MULTISPECIES: D-Ala-D-Ala carboxypeptidase family metallohydrolase [unclassified Conexibacter]MDO8189278.1 D-Ala-D-Ala carboxypeptidase family metallohydrolase [Conexibacter sp. CPCC 205706]MDO8201956.1 D-Ala-D-Ala carboxypeptidase family metallohydrolase [Conexibacter sp. CPCC 205762]MDR9372579.1 D-Ala-D-Ala carboxypeptidase family metallohydrolase [Conexibacter sp. JD483]